LRIAACPARGAEQPQFTCHAPSNRTNSATATNYATSLTPASAWAAGTRCWS